MKCLAVNTATRVTSIAIVEGERVSYLFETPEMRDQGNVLLGHIQDGLARCGIGFSDLDLLAVVTGPGSFTGIRIGLALMRGIALAAGKPLVGLSSFDMFAAPEADAVNIIAVESWREELYFEVRDAGGALTAEAANETPGIFSRRFQGGAPAGKKIIISGDAKTAAAAFLEQAMLTDKDANAAEAARLAIKQFKKGTVSARPLPYYLREADVTISTKTARTLGTGEV